MSIFNMGSQVPVVEPSYHHATSRFFMYQVAWTNLKTVLFTPREFRHTTRGTCTKVKVVLIAYDILVLSKTSWCWAGTCNIMVTAQAVAVYDILVLSKTSWCWSCSLQTSSHLGNRKYTAYKPLTQMVLSIGSYPSYLVVLVLAASCVQIVG